MIKLHESQDLSFFVDREYNIKYLSPVLRYVQWKLENNNWDDYNEFYHASMYMEKLKTYDDIWFDSHLLLKNDGIIGVLFIVGGKIAKLEKKCSIEDESMLLLLKYFHITEKGNGFGSTWLNKVIFPYYKEKGYQQIYVNSSHPDSFSFYGRLGKKISQYEQHSDNLYNKRIGSSFLIKL